MCVSGGRAWRARQNKTDEDIRRRVVEAGSIPLLVGFLTPSWRTNIMPSKEEQAKFRWALQTLTHITRTRDYRDTVGCASPLRRLRVARRSSPLALAVVGLWNQRWTGVSRESCPFKFARGAYTQARRSSVGQ